MPVHGEIAVPDLDTRAGRPDFCPWWWRGAEPGCCHQTGWSIAVPNTGVTAGALAPCHLDPSDFMLFLLLWAKSYELWGWKEQEEGKGLGAFISLLLPDNPCETFVLPVTT